MLSILLSLEKIKDEVTQEVYQSVSMDISQNNKEVSDLKAQLVKEKENRTNDRKLITKLQHEICELKDDNKEIIAKAADLVVV